MCVYKGKYRCIKVVLNIKLGEIINIYGNKKKIYEKRIMKIYNKYEAI